MYLYICMCIFSQPFSPSFLTITYFQPIFQPCPSSTSRPGIPQCPYLGGTRWDSCSMAVLLSWLSAWPSSCMPPWILITQPKRWSSPGPASPWTGPTVNLSHSWAGHFPYFFLSLSHFYFQALFLMDENWLPFIFVWIRNYVFLSL